MLTLFSCHRNLTKDHFIKGVVIYRAESNSPIGLIKIEDIHNRDTTNNYSTPIESPSRAVLYEYSDTLPLNLFEDVWFQIHEKGNYQSAHKIRIKKPDKRYLLTNSEKFFLLKKIKFNLHNGDKHREGPKHTRIHVITGIGVSYYSIPQSNPNVALLRYEEVETGRPDSVYVRSSDVPLDTTRSYFIQYDVLIDTFRVHTLDLNHIH